MLIQRVATALVLLVLLVVALVFLRPWGFIVLTLLFVGAGRAEWLMLTGAGLATAVVAAVVGAGAAALLYELSQTDPAWFDWALEAGATVWIGLAIMLLARGRFTAVPRARLVFRVMGVALPALAAVAVLAAYRNGLIFMVSILALVWVADIGAYFVGRAFGRHKLAPAISPGKTVEGALGGLAAVLLVAFAASAWPSVHDTFFARLFEVWPVWAAVVALAILVGMSIVGDLLESHLNRQAGVKDSSHLLPGHGGVLDRIDALLPVLPLALLLTHFW